MRPFGALLLAFLALTPIGAAADHGEPSTREAAVGGAPYDAKAPAHSETQEVAGHQVALSWFPEALAPGALVRFALAIKQKANGDPYTGEVVLTAQRAGATPPASPLPLSAAGDAWTALHVFDAPGAYALAVEFTPLPDPASGTLQIEKKTVTFRCELPGAETGHRQHALYGAVALGLVLFLLSFVTRRRAAAAEAADAPALPARPKPAAAPKPKPGPAAPPK